MVWTKKYLDGWMHIKRTNEYEWVCTKSHIKGMKECMKNDYKKWNDVKKYIYFLIIDFFLMKNIKYIDNNH